MGGHRLAKASGKDDQNRKALEAQDEFDHFAYPTITNIIPPERQTASSLPTLRIVRGDRPDEGFDMLLQIKTCE